MWTMTLTPARLRRLSVANSLLLLLGGILTFGALFLSWEYYYFPPDPLDIYGPPGAAGIYHHSPMDYMAVTFRNSAYGLGVAWGALFLATPLVLIVLGLVACAARRVRAATVVLLVGSAGLLGALFVEWRIPQDFGTVRSHHPDIGFAIALVGYACALAAGMLAGRLRPDAPPSQERAMSSPT